jgi:hypothetical protein
MTVTDDIKLVLVKQNKNRPLTRLVVLPSANNQQFYDLINIFHILFRPIQVLKHLIFFDSFNKPFYTAGIYCILKQTPDADIYECIIHVSIWCILSKQCDVFTKHVVLD